MTPHKGSIIEYRQYRAKISYDKEDDIFIGEVLEIDDSLNFYGNTLEECREAFHQSIDNYIEICNEIGKCLAKTSIKPKRKKNHIK